MIQERGGDVTLVCRSPTRAGEARKAIVESLPEGSAGKVGSCRHWKEGVRIELNAFRQLLSLLLLLSLSALCCYCHLAHSMMLCLFSSFVHNNYTHSTTNTHPRILLYSYTCEQVSVLLCDCSLESDVRRAWQEWCQGRTPSPPAAAAAAAAATTTETFTEDATASTSGAAGTTAAAESTSSSTSYPPPQLDVLVCNAGVLLNDLENTSEGVETTFACHLLFGTYLLGSLAKPSLEATKESRLVVVSE